ncbi:MAG TPA: glycosyltransferase family 2 protein [bacterium]|nr:glycosyltransferase family 2 protein [bacterium]HQI47426.1 glycosyltransferase family 2 protein [bacterium]HQJ63840.1 glycosyltransferase family 2 protein [bacterium]
MHPFISIIMPIRNEEAYIANALASIQAQDYPADRYEVLVIDGMSDDRTRMIVKSQMESMPNLRLFDNPDQIVPHALNIGIAQSRGEIIIRVDGHVALEKNYLSLCIAYLERVREADCVGGIIISMNSSFIGEAIALAMSSTFGVGNAYFRTRQEGDQEDFVDSVAFGAYRRQLFTRIGLFDEELVRCQDDEFNYRLRKSGGRIFLTPLIRSYYFSRTSLRALWRQYFQYGLWKVRVLQKHPTMMMPRQFVPLAFVTGLFGSFVLAPFWRPAVFLAMAILVAYLAMSLYFSIRICVKKGFRYLRVLPIIFFILHASYGLGFLLGLIRFLGRPAGRQFPALQQRGT